MQVMAFLKLNLTWIAKQTMDTLFPITCPECEVVIDSNQNPGVFCHQCRGELVTINDTITCETCQSIVASEAMLLADKCYCCAKGDFRLGGIVALGNYHSDKKLGSMILQLKHGGKTWYAREFGYQLAEKITSVFPEKTWHAAVAVPLHRSRLWSRGYNQAALLAAYLANNMNIPAYKWLLTRSRKTAPQSGGRTDRQINVEGAFSAGGICKNAAVILVDDVVTTGATVSECAAELYKAGASEVLVAACAWVPISKRADNVSSITEADDDYT